MYSFGDAARPVVSAVATALSFVPDVNAVAIPVPTFLNAANRYADGAS